MKPLVLARSSGLANLHRHADGLTWLETDPKWPASKGRGRMCVVAVTPRGDRPRALASDLPRASLAIVDDVAYVASPELGVCAVRDGAIEQIASFVDASEILIVGGPELVAIVSRSPSEDEDVAPPRYDLERIDAATGAHRALMTVQDSRPLVTVNAEGIWTLSLRITDRSAFDTDLSSGTDVHVERQLGGWTLQLEAGSPFAAELGMSPPDAIAACPSGVLVADGKRIVRIDPSGALTQLADASAVDAIVAWREGAAWIEGTTVWTVERAGEAPRKHWQSAHPLREIVAFGDELAVVEDAEINPIASALGRGKRSLLLLGES